MLAIKSRVRFRFQNMCQESWSGVDRRIVEDPNVNGSVLHNHTFRTGAGLSLLFDEFAAGAAEEVLDEIGGVHAAAEVRVLQDGLFEGDGGFDSGDHVLAQRAAHFVHGVAPIFTVGNEFSDH